MNSIRHRLLLSLLTGLLACTVIMIGFAYVDTTQELRELFTDNLRRMALVIKGQAFSPAPKAGRPADMDTGELEESYVIQIWGNNGNLQTSSRPDAKLSLQSHEGLHSQEAEGQDWQIYTLKAGESGYVQVAQPQRIVTTMVSESALRALLPFVLLFILLAIVVWYVVGLSLSPLAALSRTISSWDADKMQPLSVAKAPQEIQPVVSALNGLLLKLDKAISVQRHFTADAAHELRTPLTAVKLQLDNLIRAQSEQDRQQATGKLSEGIERSIHLASQLLMASRSMAIQVVPERQLVQLSELVRSSMATFVGVAANKNIELAFEGDADCHIQGDEEGLHVLVNNLMDNAIRYTPEAGTVLVSLSTNNGQIVLEVSDSGCGIPKAERDQIFQRFYRIPGTASTGSGLGLSIVKSVAENHGAAVSVTDGPHQSGTTIRIIFPAQVSA
jgi:two-component system OmpR family sensor kinase